ncbi:hypothetical protein AC1031_020517 [Aphanomyces cochlioides]|nr:hypothetical protein AC1031_020517 [Aphanomyces cochlioides]
MVMEFRKPSTTLETIREFCSAHMPPDHKAQLFRMLDMFAMEVRSSVAPVVDSIVSGNDANSEIVAIEDQIQTEIEQSTTKRERGGSFDFPGRLSLKTTSDPSEKLAKIMEFYHSLPSDRNTMPEAARVFATTTVIPVALCLRNHWKDDPTVFLDKWRPFSHANFSKKCCSGKDSTCSQRK